MRKDYVKKCISSVSFLTSSSFVKDTERKYILKAAGKMLNQVWKVEYKSYTDHVQEQVKFFWDMIHTELENERSVYRFTAWHGESVNPIGWVGNVVLHVQPNKSVNLLLFKLTIP